MFRIAVATYLMMAQAAGSLLCCCTASRLAALPSLPAAATAGQSAPNLPTCCHKTSAGERRLPQKSPGKPQPGRPGCPCQQDDPGKSAITLGTEAGKHLQQRPLSHAPVGVLSCFVPDCPLLTAGSPRFHGTSVLPFLTTDDILHALHILRC
jgi:hypothetical protein